MRVMFSAGITTGGDWLNLAGLALLPTIVSTATQAELYGCYFGD